MPSTNHARIAALWPLVLLAAFLVEASAEPWRTSVRIRVTRGDEPVAGLSVEIRRKGAASGRVEMTDGQGVVVFREVSYGVHQLRAGSVDERLFVSSELVSVALDLDLEAPSIPAGRFGRSTLSQRELDRLPHADTMSTILETLEPVVVTDRIDVAGIESSTRALWGARGSSWIQNRVLVDGADITDPAGGVALVYPEPRLFQEVSLASAAHGPDAASPGAELRLVTRSPPSLFESSAALGYTASALQSNNIDEELRNLGVEPREIVRFPRARFEVGVPHFYTALGGFELASRLPRFRGEQKSSLIGATSKLTDDQWSLLGIVQRFRRPTFGARPDVAPRATVDATEHFQVAQAALAFQGFFTMLSFARGDLDSESSAESPALHDLVTGEVEEAPLFVTDRDRLRWTARTFGEWWHGPHSLRAGVELGHASETARVQVPGGHHRLLVDGRSHAVSRFAEGGERRIAINRLGLHVRDTLFMTVLDRPWRLAPGLRLDGSRSGPVRWWTLAPSLSLEAGLTPSSEIHFSWGRYPHLLTSRLLASARGDPSWRWHRWTDGNGDRQASEDEIGEALRRGGAEFTDLAANVPRPFTDEVTVGFHHRFHRGFLRVSGYHRRTKRLLQTVNVGIARESYLRFPFLDVGVDGVLGTSDDHELTIFDQRSQRGEDRFLLTGPDGLESFSQGVDLLLAIDHGWLSWQLSGRAYRDVGSGNVGNGAHQNDTGVLGDLFHDPNTETNAGGRLFFDRAFTGKLTFTARAPGRVDLGGAVRYWDGQPFARHLVFSRLGQGFVIVQALPRGRQRFTFNMTVDLRIARELRLGGARLTLAADVFNLFNQTLGTEENVLSGERFRDPTEVQPARALVLRGRIRF